MTRLRTVEPVLVSVGTMALLMLGTGIVAVALALVRLSPKYALRHRSAGGLAGSGDRSP